MCKTINRCFRDRLTFVSMFDAYQRSIKCKGNRSEVLKFNMDLESNICIIIRELKGNKYKLGKYRSFKIYEPKERLIMALPFKDRVVQQWYVYEFIIPFIVPRFINDSYACIKEKGTHRAMYKVEEYYNYMKKRYNDFYILKCDIKKFFYNIDKNILYKIMSKYLKDKMLLNLTKIFIFDGSGDIGIPVGNYTSQYFANIYLNELDYYIKDKLHIKCYVRYCDDFVIMVRNKKEAKEVLEKIRIYLSEVLHLELNNNTRYYPNKMGVNFCGYRVFGEYRLLRKRSIKKIRHNVKKWEYDYRNGNLNKKKMQLMWYSFLGHAKHANSYKLVSECYLRIKDINELICNR